MVPLADWTAVRFHVFTNTAETDLSAVTFKSVRCGVSTPSDQASKRYPGSGVAVTSVPFEFQSTTCVADPTIDPPTPAVYASV